MMIADLIQLLQPALNELGYELWGCEYLSQGKYSLLRIYIDKPDGIGIQDCERASHQISAILDVEDPITGNYTLEVSSPGLDRPLFNPAQFKKYIGSSVNLKLYQPVLKKKKLNGTIISVDDESVLIENKKERSEVLFSNIAKANLTV